ncbi:Ldh family oxidoreductase [Haloarcula nitratireducens]|uniref:Ldh family oxidoreductase n=1 Tax=Haloarcula nitratireducens TaxID=2487749 RepID=A0AAW4PFU3_9EURY|nr:Ldh family oxidoreductase [Halomicroarcula nitratireducens]MBX0296441.1 Ldh family oxidoreductase [Halomicroarcula nitratireducens]
MKLDRSRAVSVAAAAFRAHGISEADAEQTAEVLVSADARGKHSHGLLRLPRFVRGIEHGNVDPEGDIEVVSERGGTATLSGGSRLGPVVASTAVGVAMDRADEFGVGAVGVHDSNHLGMLGYYTDQLQREGYVGIAVTNTEPAMPPYGGAEPVLGTNPIAIGLPTDPVFNLDMSTSAIARGTIFEKREAGESIPEGVALDAQGEPTTDPEAALGGTILPFGGSKGSGLAIAVEVLAGGLVGAAMGQDVTGTYHTENPCTKGDLFLAIDPEALGASDFPERASAFLRELTAGPTAAHVDGIRLPGQHSVERDRSATTVEIEDDLWDEVRSLAGDD